MEVWQWLILGLIALTAGLALARVILAPIHKEHREWKASIALKEEDLREKRHENI